MVSKHTLKRQHSVVKIWQLIGGPWRRRASHGTTGTVYTVVKFLFVYLSVYLSGYLFIRLFYSYYNITYIL